MTLPNSSTYQTEKYQNENIDHPEVAEPNEPWWNGALISAGVGVIVAATFVFTVWYLLGQ